MVTSPCAVKFPLGSMLVPPVIEMVPFEAVTAPAPE